MQITRVCKTLPVIICDLTGHFRWTAPSAPLSVSMTNSIPRSKTMKQWFFWLNLKCGEPNIGVGKGAAKNFNR